MDTVLGALSTTLNGLWPVSFFIALVVTIQFVLGGSTWVLQLAALCWLMNIACSLTLITSWVLKNRINR